MFEREITDVMFLDRWSIVRTLKPQSVAEHSWAVAMYANDICTYLEMPQYVHLAVLQYALWHDVDEIFSGDMPGPNKRALLEAAGENARRGWKNRLSEWMAKTFSNPFGRSGGHTAHTNGSSHIVYSIVKCADWLEASIRMATETQLGNRCTERHIVPNMNGAIDSAREVVTHMARLHLTNKVYSIEWVETSFGDLREFIMCSVHAAQHEQSRGPFITGEDDRATAGEKR